MKVVNFIALLFRLIVLSFGSTQGSWRGQTKVLMLLMRFPFDLVLSLVATRQSFTICLVESLKRLDRKLSMLILLETPLNLLTPNKAPNHRLLQGLTYRLPKRLRGKCKDLLTESKHEHQKLLQNALYSKAKRLPWKIRWEFFMYLAKEPFVCLGRWLRTQCKRIFDALRF
jgi:hypothetical protein